jgi:tRNA U54 and U55 pseudouridine synthase Pus10
MKKNVEIFTIKVICKKCSERLYKYRKEGKGHLIKCFVDGIIKDYTRGDLRCPKCGQLFARLSQFKGRFVHKIIQGKVACKGGRE